MPEGEPRFLDINPEDDENPHKVDERVAKPEIKDEEDATDPKPVDSVEGFSEEELEAGARDDSEDEPGEKNS